MHMSHSYRYKLLLIFPIVENDPVLFSQSWKILVCLVDKDPPQGQLRHK